MSVIMYPGLNNLVIYQYPHNDTILYDGLKAWKRFLHYWPTVGGIHLPPRESLSQMAAIRNFEFVITFNKLLKPATASKDVNL